MKTINVEKGNFYVDGKNIGNEITFTILTKELGDTNSRRTSNNLKLIRYTVKYENEEYEFTRNISAHNAYNFKVNEIVKLKLVRYQSNEYDWYGLEKI